MDLQTLHEIDEELTKSDVAAMKFLCMDILHKKRLESVKDAKDLFMRLREQDLLNSMYFLAELLYTIGRCDLLHPLGTNKLEISSWLQTRTDTGSGISPYRKMLYKLSEDVTTENLQAIKFLLEGLPKAKLQDSATFLDVLAEMEKMQKLTEDNLDELVNVLDKCDKQLVNTVQEFRNMQIQREKAPVSPHHPEQEEPRETHSIDPLSIAETSPDEQSSGTLLPDSSVQSEEANDFYPLKRRPRGYCLIINNFKFNNAQLKSTQNTLQNRKGTDKDAEELTRVFKKLHFLPVERKDLGGSEMLDVTREFAQKNHSEMDAFVCCILSHGHKGTVLGTDGQDVQIKDLTQPFARCLTLFGKPKVFFIQACQGDGYQRPLYIRADGEEESIEKQLEEDAQSDALRTIPISADFLIGMATVESFKSFRHIYKGSIFIQELCKQLENGMKSKEDILSILTKVNREVGSQLLNGYKQMPEPRYTLTKKLVFTLD